MTEYKLKYGCNPNQNPARIHMDGQALPFQILNGAAGYINLLDAFNSWQLVRERDDSSCHSENGTPDCPVAFSGTGTY